VSGTKPIGFIQANQLAGAGESPMRITPLAVESGTKSNIGTVVELSSIFFSFSSFKVDLFSFAI